MRKSVLTEHGKKLVKEQLKNIENRRKFIGPPLSYEMSIKKIKQESEEC